MSIGEILREYRKEHGLSQRQFAERCGDVTNGYISMIEQGRNPSTGKPIIPSIDKLASLARGMNMSLKQLLTMADDMPVFVGDAERWDAEMTEEKGEQTDTTDWVSLAPGFKTLPAKQQESFKAMLNTIWDNMYKTATNKE